MTGAETQSAFLAEVGAFGPRRESATLLAEALRAVRRNTNIDMLPMEAIAAVHGERSSPGISQAMVGHTRMASHAQLWADPPGLEEGSSSDVIWDRIVAITPEGEEDVFDLTVPGPASWLADGVVSHNSGSLEQDSDMILLIYREEVYDRNTTKKGIAEIDLVKHRNGEIGTFLLTFQGQYTRFANYVSDSYAEGVLR